MDGLEAALEWASSLLHVPVSLDATPSAQSALIKLHESSLASDAAHAATAASLRARAARYRTLTASTPKAPPLDEGALADVAALADILAALQCDTDDAVGATVGVAQRWAREMAATARERAEAAAAERRLREAARRLAAAAVLERDVKGEGEVDSEVELKRAKAERMKTKAREYVGEVERVREEVRGSGVAGDITHEAILGVAEETSRMEKRLQEVEAQLGRYHGLPADAALVERKIKERRREIQTLDEEISNAITGIV